MLGQPTDWDVVFFASVDFDTHDQRPQAVARDLAARGARVLYVDNIGLRLPRPRDARRVWRRVRSSLRRRRVPPAVGSPVVGATRTGSLAVVSPVLLPLDHIAAARASSRRLLRRRIRRWRAGSTRDVVVWTFLPNPLIAEVAADLGAARLVYEYADLASVRLHSPSVRHRARVARWETTMFERADAVVVPTPRLVDGRGLVGPRVHVVPHGTPPDHAGSPSTEIQALPRPRIAFVGSISPVVDLDLLGGIARNRPGWSVVLVGPARVSVRHLKQLDNVYVIGELPQRDVSALLAGVDVGLVPYRLDVAGVQTVSPLKIGDYLAAGLPVVTVDLGDDHPPGTGILTATGVDGFVDAIERSLRDGPRAVGPLRTWSDAVGETIDLVRSDPSPDRVEAP
jgi:glycosyltransferase involved in cell wall biosynthesis